MERFNSFFNQNVSSKDYVYAEIQGSNLINLISRPEIDPVMTYCNDFYQTMDIYGIEGLRNLLAYDLIKMINSNGYVNVKFPTLTVDLNTYSGINPMTSEGISSQQRGVLSNITFDNSTKYITRASLYGKKETTNGTSISILIGKKFHLGTGYANVKIDTSKIIVPENLHVEDSYILNYEEDKSFDIIPGKFPLVKWVIDRFVHKDIIHYIESGINNCKLAIRGKIKSQNVVSFRKKLGRLFAAIKVIPDN